MIFRLKATISKRKWMCSTVEYECPGEDMHVSIKNNLSRNELNELLHLFQPLVLWDRYSGTSSKVDTVWISARADALSPLLLLPSPGEEAGFLLYIHSLSWWAKCSNCSVYSFQKTDLTDLVLINCRHFNQGNIWPNRARRRGYKAHTPNPLSLRPLMLMTGKS